MELQNEPERVAGARLRATRMGFELSCEPLVGRLLSVLAAAVPAGGRVLELGTGAGVGLAWIVAGLGERDDVEVVSVECSAATLAATREESWPRFVELVLADGAEAVERLGEFDLIFPDAPGGKLENLDGSIRALRRQGVLIVDDMDLDQHDDPDLERQLRSVRGALLGDPRLCAVDLEVSSGVIVCTRLA